MDKESAKMLNRIAPNPVCPKCGLTACYYGPEAEIWCIRCYLGEAASNSSEQDLMNWKSGFR